MAKAIQSSGFFVVGGTLEREATSYVHRPADDHLLYFALAGEYCNVLAARQTGKSSLMVATAERLKHQGIKPVIIDLTSIGSMVSADEWYFGLLSYLSRHLNLYVDEQAWWNARKENSPVQRFSDFLQEVILREIHEPIVIFVDEIDSTLKLGFTDDFFAAIRALYNARSQNTDLKRLTFVLLGVARPSDLIKDRTRTPYNVGTGIEVTDFQIEEMGIFESVLEKAYPGQGRQILEWVLEWTGGQPYLTQKLCELTIQQRFQSYDDQGIDNLVTELFLTKESSSEFRFIRDSIISHPLKKHLLSLYKKVFIGRRVPEDKTSVIQNQLKLSGLVKVEDRHLVVSNQIYRRVFNLDWTNKNSEINWLLISAVVLGFVVATLIALITHDSVYLPKQVAQSKDCASNPKNANRLSCMAFLFQKSPILGTNDYDYDALDLFFNLRFWSDQKDPFAYENVSPNDLKIVIKGLYTSLADIEDSDESTRLLQVMAESLIRVNLGEDNLYDEIQHWISARRLKNNNDLTDALNEYKQALLLNPENSATLFERGRLYNQLGEYQNALRDYDQVVAIGSRSALIEPTETPVATFDVNVTPSIIALTPTSSQLLTQEVTGTSTVLQTAAFTSTLEASSTLVATGIPADIPTISPELTSTYPQDDQNPVRSSFITSSQQKAAVRNEIVADQNFLSLLITLDPLDYPNLRELGVFPVVTETPAVQTETLNGTPAIAEIFDPYPDPADYIDIKGIPMRLVHAEEFVMGSDNSESDEGPTHPVYLDAYYIDKYEVTNAFYKACVDARVCLPPQNTSSLYNFYGNSEYDNYPVMSMSWNMAKTYCEWRGAQLPTEAQWEKAARGTDGRTYPWGEEIDQTFAHYGQSAGTPAAVGSYPKGKSPYGVYDMAGNVWEWVEDWYSKTFYANSPVSNPSGPGSGQYRVLRGGTWYYGSERVHTFSRDFYPPDEILDSFGFRCARDASP